MGILSQGAPSAGLEFLLAQACKGLTANEKYLSPFPVNTQHDCSVQSASIQTGAIFHAVAKVTYPPSALGNLVHLVLKGK